MYIAQAIELSLRTLRSNASDADKALALCWLCHLVGDAHQPCHAGSLYVEHVFAEGDRGGNSIKLTNGRNLHALWDGLLGSRFSEGDVNRRIREIQALNLPVVSQATPAIWLAESRAEAKRSVYTAEIMQPVSLVMRQGETKLAELT